MAGSVIGALRVDLGLNSAAFIKGTRDAQSSMQRMSAKMVAIGAGLTASLSTTFVGLGKLAVDGALAQRQAVAQVESALASMGDAAGKTTAELVKASDALEMRSLFDGDVILKQVTANLLTFGNVAGEQFDRAQQAALDMATRLGGEPQAAAIQLGKALNDPVKGITALTRVGVQFTEQQKAQIEAMTEAGNVAGAQGIILSEVEKQFAGAAAAAADASPYRQLQVAMGQLGDAIGEILLPFVQQAAQFMADLAKRFAELEPETQTTIVALGAFAAAAGPVLIVLGSMASGLSALVALGPAVASAFGIIRVAALALMANPVILGFAAVLTGIYLAWQNWDKITEIVSRMYQGVKTWLMDKLGAVFNWLRQKIKDVTGFFFDMYDAVVGNSYVPDMVEGIGTEFGKLQDLMVEPARKAASDVKSVMKAMADEVAAMGVPGLSIADRDARLAAIGGRPLDEIEELEKAANRWADAQNDLKTKSETTAVTIAESFGQMADRTLQAFDRMVGAIRGGGFLDILGSVIGLGLQLGGMGAFGKTIQGNINRPPSFAGGGFTGMGARAGGLDGKGGFMAMLHPRETVLDHTKGQGMGGRVHVTVGVDPASGNITAFVNNQIAATAPAIASAGAAMAQGQLAQRAQRRVR